MKNCTDCHLGFYHKYEDGVTRCQRCGELESKPEPKAPAKPTTTRRK